MLIAICFKHINAKAVRFKKLHQLYCLHVALLQRRISGDCNIQQIMRCGTDCVLSCFPCMFCWCKKQRKTVN